MAVLARGLVVAMFAIGCGIADDHERGELTLIESSADAPTWAVAYGHEPWSHDEGMNMSRVVERVHHAIRRDPTTGLARVNGSGYMATFDGDGMHFESRGPGVTVRTARIAFGDDVVYAERGVPWSLLGNTAQARLAPSVVEHYEARTDGVEITWLVRERGTGNLTIELALEGARSVAQGDAAALVDSAGVVQARVGAAQLVDATGEHFPIETDVVAGGIRWRVPADVLARAEFPVAVDPLIGPETLVADPVIGPSLAWQDSPRVAASSSGYLVVWTDNRGTGQYGDWDLYGTRVSPSGIVLDPAGIYLAPEPDELSPELASNGTDYLVVWKRENVTSAPIQALRVGANGNVLDASPIAISPPTAGRPQVASNGSDYLVTYLISAGGLDFDVYATRVTAQGSVLDANGILVATAVPPEIAVASNGANYLIAYPKFNPSANIFATRVASDGSVLDSTGIEVSTPSTAERNPAVASDGTNYFVVWNDYRNTEFDLNIFGAMVTGSGAVTAPNGIAVTTAAQHQRNPKIAWNGSAYLAVWEDLRLGTDIFAARISAAGTVLDPDGIAIRRDKVDRSAPSVAARNGDFLVAWQQQDRSATYYGNLTSWDVYAQRITSAGALVQPSFPLAFTPNMYDPAIASNGTTFLVAWKDTRAFEATGFDIISARLSATGDTLDPAGIVVSNAPSYQVAPALASNGTDYFVAWEDFRNGLESDVYGSRVSAAGVVLDPSGLSLSTANGLQADVTIGSDGANYLVAWDDWSAADIHGTRVTSAGAVLDPIGIPLATGTESDVSPALGSNGMSYFLAWRQNGKVVGRRLTTSGIADTASVNVSYTETSSDPPSVTSNGADYLVAWSSFWDIRATRVSAAGTLPDAAAVYIYQGLCRPAAASDGADYLVSFYVCHSGGLSLPSVYASRVSAAGLRVDSTPLSIADSPEAETNPTIAYNAASHGYAIAYEARQRTYIRLIRFCGDGQIEASETCDDGAYANSDGCSASCRIEPGYNCYGAPSVCSDINECATNNGGCSPNAICTNALPGFSCTCASGYSGDGITCADIDECATNNGGCAVTCTNSAGSYACSCPFGFVLASDGHGCDDIDECATNNGDCASTCNNTAGSYTCSCPAGFALDADLHGCTDVDECATNNGGCAQVCTNAAGSHSCHCDPGYTLGSDGTSCTAPEPEPCSENAPCPSDEETGCGCRTTTPSQSLLLIGVLFFVRRKRR
jgi:cysteine-rich repeat protein